MARRRINTRSHTHTKEKACMVPSIVFSCLWHFGGCFQFDKMLSNMKSFEAWVINLVYTNLQRTNQLLSGLKFFLKKSVILDFFFLCPKVMRTYFLDAVYLLCPMGVENCGLCMRWYLACSSYMHVMNYLRAYDVTAEHLIDHFISKNSDYDPLNSEISEHGIFTAAYRHDRACILRKISTISSHIFAILKYFMSRYEVWL